jgi:hypothetical protein
MSRYSSLWLRLELKLLLEGAREFWVASGAAIYLQHRQMDLATVPQYRSEPQMVLNPS